MTPQASYDAMEDPQYATPKCDEVCPLCEEHPDDCRCESDHDATEA